MKKRISFIFLRYLILLALALFNLYLIRALFTPLTIYPVLFILKIFYSPVIIKGNTIIFNSHAISLVSACIAGSAYYLLLLLNLSTPMSLKTRLRSISFVLLVFLSFNILRILFFFVLFLKDFSYFDITHRIFWYFGSTILVIAIWFFNVYLFKIKEIPVYSDVRFLLKLFKKPKKKISRPK